MICRNIFSVLFLLDEAVRCAGSSAAVSGSGAHGWRAPVDCVKASDLCNVNHQCSSRYRILRQCLAGRDRNTMLANKECQAALEVLQESPLYDCRCKRGMKKELQCLQNYWSIHLGLTEGEEFYETSPYEPPRLASIISDPPGCFFSIDNARLDLTRKGMDSTVMKGNHCSDTGKPCNPCLDAAKACNLNDTCKKLRSMYISVCTRVSPFQSPEPCNRKKCHKALRQFFDRVQTEYSYRLLFCSCRDTACAERRRQTIVPSCAYEDKVKPNCLELRTTCRNDPLCRSRLADFHANCRVTPHSITSCPNDNCQACLASYAGLIGSDMTPNYVDASYTDITISPWCTCRSSGNMEDECEKFLKDFTENTCLKNAIQAFGNGTDANSIARTPSLPAIPSVKTKAETERFTEPLVTLSTPGYNMCVSSTGANLLESGTKCNPSKVYVFEPETQVHPNPFDLENIRNVEPEDVDRSDSVHMSSSVALLALSCLALRMAL
ncbi:GDNF family receptor alpha-2 [Lepisosteus oculatus]|uniref:GDNF family receptor alpha-2 n=1 Tax=Lepisosteus oculatus TaxID=7918 RepID=UPI0035F503ED